MQGLALGSASLGSRAARPRAPLGRRSTVRAAAESEDADAELERRLAAFKGTRNWKEVRAERSGEKPAAGAGEQDGEKPAATGDQAPVAWGTEVVFQDGPPARGDLATNLLLGATLLWLPLSLAAVGRALWVNYKITDKRVSVTSTSPFGAEQLDAAYEQMTEVRAIGRGLGYWGDMVIVLNDGSKMEMRSIDNWQEVKKYIDARIADANTAKEARWAAKGSKQ